MRGRGRFLEWTLQDTQQTGLRYVGKCGICSAFCIDTDSDDEARKWCLEHVGATGHVFFEVTASLYLDAVLADHPAGAGTPPT
ncbi:DUF7848 domain-containing protein [Streptomyces sp. A1-5]|uniref:DUF7848 domain-containing protein n=1 Tax=Streptomyces sp. A1-5 TaxID=2738410 RepID=UPI003FA77F47